MPSCSTPLNNTAKGGMIGGAGGAGVGALIGGLIGKGKGAGIGAAVGAAVGTGAGVFIGRKMDKAAEQAKQIEGAKVELVLELMPYSSGLKRNISQCLDDFDIPLYLNHTITKIEGKDRVTGVVVSKVDGNKKPIKGTEIHFDCDTVLFSVGLIPENELTKCANIELSPKTRGAIVYQNRETLTEGVFACGNVLQVHDLVDFVSEESEVAGRYAASYVLEGAKPRDTVEVVNGKNVSYVVPQRIDKNIGGNVKLFFRATNTFRDCIITAKCGDTILNQRKKKIVVPGEMETLLLTETKLAMANDKIEIVLEETV